jgi:PDZ domain-containing protein
VRDRGGAGTACRLVWVIMSWFTALTVRGRALLVGLLLTSLLVTLGSTVKIPYVALGPGTTINTLGSFNGTPVFTFSGTDIPAAVQEPEVPGSHLDMTTVSVTDGMTLFGALGLWATGTFTLVPREEQFPPDQTVEQVQARNAKDFKDSQSASEVAALRHLGYPEVVYVGAIPEGSPSVEVLDPQDRIVAVDDQPVTTFDSLRAILLTTSPGDVAKVTVVRTAADGTPTEVDAKVTLAANAESGSHGFLGISAVQRPLAPFAVTNALVDSGIGGPSAGLMFTLGLLDRLTAGDLASGHFIAGTGTIDENGAVGRIGGIVLKLIAAREAGATVFLVPDQNCAEALTRVPDGLTLVRVASLSDAMAALDAVRDGSPTTGC